MELAPIFIATSYRSFIKYWTHSQNQPHGLLSQMCKAMNCQNAHLTRVLKEEVHLTMDQLFRLCSFLKLNKAESTFFMKLAEHDRAGDILYRNQLKEEMRVIKQEQENLSKRFQHERIDNFEKEMTYYSSWHWVALHFITQIEKFQKSEQIADRLGLSEVFVRRSLETLERLGLIKKQGDTWSPNTKSIHLPKTSPLNSVQHGNWRNRAVLKSQDINDDGLHYTVVQTISHEDFENIKQLFLHSIDQYKKIAKPSKSEELICFSLDFFRV